ncbi:hypothetical protein [Streptomyces microflavus]|uniref:hypothetical protein n=1 Tax=Streptomyces microflavus TaxID=1919 RepID=UPI0036AD6F1D
MSKPCSQLGIDWIGANALFGWGRNDMKTVNPLAASGERAGWPVAGGIQDGAMVWATGIPAVRSQPSPEADGWESVSRVTAKTAAVAAGLRRCRPLHARRVPVYRPRP